MSTEKNPSTFGLSPDKIGELLGIGSDSDSNGKPGADESKAELLLDRLAQPLLPDTALSRFVPDVPEFLVSVISSCEGIRVGDLLLNKEVDVALLGRIKNDNGKLSQQADNRVRKDVAVALYYAAIASALVFHHRKISDFSFADLDKAFQKLQQKEWISMDLRDLYDKASVICRNPSGIEADASGQ
jgi:hypothetical protein